MTDLAPPRDSDLFLKEAYNTLNPAAAELLRAFEHIARADSGSVALQLFSGSAKRSIRFLANDLGDLRLRVTSGVISAVQTGTFSGRTSDPHKFPAHVAPGDVKRLNDRCEAIYSEYISFVAGRLRELGMDHFAPIALADPARMHFFDFRSIAAVDGSVEAIAGDLEREGVLNPPYPNSAFVFSAIDNFRRAYSVVAFTVPEGNIVQTIAFRDSDGAAMVIYEGTTQADPFLCFKQCLVLLLSANAVQRRVPMRHKPLAGPANNRNSYHVVSVELERGEGGLAGPAGPHRSPRLHFRRGHLRTLPSGDRVWVRHCIVGMRSGAGVIDKHYEARAAK